MQLLSRTHLQSPAAASEANGYGQFRRSLGEETQMPHNFAPQFFSSPNYQVGFFNFLVFVFVFMIKVVLFESDFKKKVLLRRRLLLKSTKLVDSMAFFFA